MTAIATKLGEPGGRILTKRQRYDSLRSQLSAERDRFRPHWQEISDYILPRRARWFVSDVNRGDRRSNKIIDTSATLAIRTLAAGMMSGVTSPARPWFRLTVPDPDLAEVPAVKFWLHDVTLRMLTVFAQSNFYNVLPTFYKDLGAFGTAAMGEVEDDESIIRFHSFPIGSYMLGNDARQRVRTWINEYRMTVRQIVEEFAVDPDTGAIDWANISDATREQWQRGNIEEWVDVRHVITTNWDHDPKKLDSKFKAYASCHYEVAASSHENKLLREKGFDEFPIFVARWEVTGEDTYATDCPGMTALGDIKQLQLGEKRGLEAIDKLVRPPMIGPTSLKTGKVTTLPGDVTWQDVRSQYDSFRPTYQVKPEIEALEFKQAQVRNRIDRAFFTDLFLMIAAAPDVQRTAREIEERHEEKLLALGPVLEQLNDGVFNPAIDRTFAVMLRRGVIPQPPEELEGVALKVDFISIMAQAQKAVGLGGLERFINDVAVIAQARPDALDNVNVDELVDELADMNGISPKILVNDEEVAEIRGARAQAQQQAQMAAVMKDAGAGAKNLSEAKTDTPSALTALLQQGEQAA